MEGGGCEMRRGGSGAPALGASCCGCSLVRVVCWSAIGHQGFGHLQSEPDLPPPASPCVSLSPNSPAHRRGVQGLLWFFLFVYELEEFSPDGRFIISADRDFKIRVTVFPRRPLSGAHEIQSFCLAHSDFVSCLAFVVTPEYPQGFLLSGSGDSTVRLWDFISGCLLDTCEIREKAEFVEANGEEECYPAVTNLCASRDGSMIAVAIQSFHGVMLLSCDLSLKALAVTRVVPIEDSFIPTCLGISYSAENLWLVTGASNLPSSGSLPLACVRVISRLRNRRPDSGELGPVMLKDESVPGGEKLLEKLQGSVNSSKQEMALAAAAEAVKMAMRNLLIKKQYSTEKREFRKRSRNDRKIKQ